MNSNKVFINSFVSADHPINLGYFVDPQKTTLIQKA